MDNIIEELKKQVRWDMDWKSEKENPVTGHHYADKPDVEVVFEKEIALAILLLSSTVFLNDHWWMKDEGWPEDACNTASLNVNQNDILAWGVADAEEMKYSDIQDVYEHWEKDPSWGPAVWFCKKMNMMPQKPVADSIRAGGIWDLDSMGLEPNPTDKHFGVE